MPALGISTTETDPFYLYIPMRRFILMSFFTFGLYQTYWIYKNWQYVKNRDNLNIHPFWRAMFGIFFCDSLFKKIHEDPLLQQYRYAAFNPTGLAVGWILFSIGGNLFSRFGDIIFTNPLVYLGIVLLLLAIQIWFFVPVQQYINEINEQGKPSAPYYPWSAGHFVLLGISVVIIIVGLAAAAYTM